MTVTWASTSPRLAAERNRPLMIENAMIDRSRTASGPEDRAGVQDVLDAQAQRLGFRRRSNPVSGSRCARGRHPAGRTSSDETSLAIGDLPVRQEEGPAGACRAGRAEDRQPQQFCWPKVVSWDATPVCGWSVIRLTPVSTKVLPAVASGLVPSLANCGDRVDALLRHLQRVLLRGGAELAAP